MSPQTRPLARSCGLLAALALLSAGARAQFADYTRRVPVTITNNGVAATPTPTSAEVTFPLDSANMRSDRLDLRVAFNDGVSLTEIDSKAFRAPGAYLNQTLNAGASSYAALPTGSKLTFTNNSNSLDDNFTLVTLPFNFPFKNGVSNQMLVHIDGFVSPGQTTDPGRPDSISKAQTDYVIMPWQSDFAITDTSIMGVYFSADANRAVVRWEVQESASGPIIAKFAVVLTPNGDIRFAYGNPVLSPSAGIAGPSSYSPIKFGVGVGAAASSIVNAPTHPADFSNHSDILYTQSLGSGEATRLVFRLQQPIPAGGSSTGQYFVYYGNPSPSLTAKHDLKNVFDSVVDFNGPNNVVGQPAPDWDVQVGNTLTVEQYQGKQVGVLRGGAWHPRATVKQGVMPAFLNVEVLTHYAAFGNGNKQMGALARVDSDPNSANFQGGYGYGVGWGTDTGENRFIASFINPNYPGSNPPGNNPYTSDPSAMGPIKADSPVVQNNKFLTTLFRVTGDPGLIQGKNWNDGNQEPLDWFLQANRTDFNPTRNINGSWIEDPVYNQAGTAGVMSYVQYTAVDYLALRELRDLSGATGGSESLTPTGPFIQGSVTSSVPALNPLLTATLRITGPGGYDQTFTVGADGTYRVSLPAGSYTVVAVAPDHITQTLSNVSPTASGQTNIVLPYTAADFQGTVRDVFTGQPYAGYTVVAVDTNGTWQGSAVTDAQGRYAFRATNAGALNIAALGVGVDNAKPGAGLGQRKAVNVAPHTTNTVDFEVAALINGDFEIPTEDATAPLGWGINRFTPRDPAGIYNLDTAQNHTPGGRYSISITDPSADFEAWIPTNFQWATVNPNANYTVSAWVYFTQAGQRARLRVITMDNAGNAINIEAPAGGPFITAGSPDVASGLQAPVGQWTKVEVTIPADPRLGKLGNRLYACGPTQGGIGAGAIYFDDFTVSAAPIAQGLGRLVDANDNPVAGAFVGPLTPDLIIGEPVIWNGAYSVTDANGNFAMYAAEPGPVNIAAFNLPTIQNGVLPDYGYVVDPTTASLNATATPGARQTVRLLAAGNVADGAAADSVDANGNSMNNPSGRSITTTVDNNVYTRWDSGVPSEGGLPVTTTFTLPQVEMVDQIELLWELADLSNADISVDDGSGAFLPIVSQDGLQNLGLPAGALDYSPFTEGTTHVFHFPTARPVKAIQIVAFGGRGSITNFSLIELRALSLANAPVLPIGPGDVAKALKVAGGIVTATSADIARLDADADGKITVLDAAALRRSIP